MFQILLLEGDVSLGLQRRLHKTLADRLSEALLVLINESRDLLDLVLLADTRTETEREQHLPIVPPLVIRPTTWNELEQQLREIRKRSQSARENVSPDDQNTLVEQIHNPIFTSVGRAVEQYVKIRGNTAAIEENFERWVFGDFWKTHARSLAPETRQMLISAEYVWQEYTQTQLDDWAAPAIQYCRALERELKRRLYEPSLGYRLKGSGWTLGTPLHAHKRGNQEARDNWNILAQLVAKSNASHADFEQLWQRLEAEQIRDLRNELAHGGAASQQIALKLRSIMIGSRQQQGVLVWLAEQLEPLP